MGLVPLQVGGIEPHATGLLDGHAHEKLPTILLFYVCFSSRYSFRIEFSRERAVGTGNPFNLSRSFLSHSTSAHASAVSVVANSPRECLAVISVKAKCLEVGRPAVPVLTASIAPQTSAAAGFQTSGGLMPSARSHSIAIARGTDQFPIK